MGVFKPGDRVEIRFLVGHSRVSGYSRWCWRRGTFSHYEGAFGRVHLDIDAHIPDQLTTYYADRIRRVGLLDLIAEV